MDKKEELNESERPVIIGELLFVLLPFLIVAIIQLSILDFNELIYSYTWGLAATILFGQSIFKLTLGVASYEKTLAWKKFGLLIAALIVLGLIPSAIVMVLFALNINQNIWIVILQFSLFILSTISFYYLGALGQKLSNNAFLRKISEILELDNQTK